MKFYRFIYFVILSSIITGCDLEKKKSLDLDKNLVIIEVNTYLNDRQYDTWASQKSNKTNLISVFVYYGVDIEMGIYRELKIPVKSAMDTNLIYNCILKSMDTTWVNRHIYMSSDSIMHAW